jgi:hypothetical protein
MGILPLFSLLFAFGACSSDPAAPATGDGGAAGGAGGSGTASGGSSGAADPNAVIGSFDLRLVAPVPATAETDAVPGTMALDGLVSTGPQPPQRTLKQTMQEGDCVLLIPSVPFCNPTCGSNATCVAINTTSNAGACQPIPTARSAGTVTFTGLTTTAGMAPVVLEPDPKSHVYSAGPEAKLVYPAFQEGTDLGLSAAGADVPAFTAKSKGIHLLEVIASGPIKLEKEQPLALRWTKSGQPGTSRIEVKLDISHHGGFKGQISCDTADSGSLDIAAKLTTGLIGLGVAGYPTISLVRKAVGYAQLPTGRVGFSVTSSNEQPVVVAGFVSCSEKEPCPAGKTCGDDLVCHVACSDKQPCPTGQTCGTDMFCH